MKELFYRYNPWWEKGYVFEGFINRPLVLETLKKQISSKEIVFLTGLRRIGKTTSMKMLIDHLIKEKGVNPDYIFYISLDDYLLNKQSILEVVEEYRKIKQISYSEKIWIFLDEVTYKKDFEQQLKNLYDGGKIKIFCSSSCASVLKEKKAYLTGRNLVFEILPLDFHEYLEFKNIKVNIADSHLLPSYFEDYLQTGGIPEFVINGNMDYLRELVDDIIYKDIVGIYNIKKPQILKDFFVLLMERSGKLVSVNKIARILKISPDTANRYLQMFASTYLVHLLPRYAKTNEKILSPKKVYASDLGIKNLFTGWRDKGSFFENYIYLKIKNKNPHYVYEKGIEIDFLTEDKTLIEVKYNQELNEKQQALFDSFKVKKKIIVSGFKDVKKIE